jgi:hypothetical protein
MLDHETIKKIENFVYEKPRSVQEIAVHIGKSWRTADRYIEDVQKEFGTISTRTFREGTRGALKIVYWSSMEKVNASAFQEKLEQQVMSARRKEDFSSFDIFQYVDDKNKKAKVEEAKTEDATNLQELKDILLSAKKQILVFSGNLSFINFHDKNIEIFDIIEELAKRNVSIKVLCRVDLTGKENIEKMLSLNFKHGKQNIEIRHSETPLRALIIDNNIIRLKEIKEPTGRKNELNKKLFIFYTIKDKDWAAWLSRIFWKIFASSISAEKRLEEMKKLK